MLVLVGSAQHGLLASKQAGQQKHHDCKRVRVWCGCDLVVSLSPVSKGNLSSWSIQPAQWVQRFVVLLPLKAPHDVCLLAVTSRDAICWLSKN
jgi:hypothetical protein